MINCQHRNLLRNYGPYKNEQLGESFWVQAKAALPFGEQLGDVDELFNAMCLQRAVLRKNQRLEEWR